MRDETPEEKLLHVVQRALGASSVRVAAAGTPPPEADNVLATHLTDGRVIIAVFEKAPEDAVEKRARLEAFAASFEAPGPPRRRVPVAPTAALDDELRVLAKRAGAQEALVIDAQSPVVWGASTGGARRVPLVSPLDVSSPFLVGGAPAHDFDDVDDDLPPSTEAFDENDREALLDAVRSHPDVHAVARGKTLAGTYTFLLTPPPAEPIARIGRSDSQGPTSGPNPPAPPVSADVHLHSFNDIYLVLLPFRPYSDESERTEIDQLAVARAIAESIGRIERLVSALPPLDPDPAAGAVVAFRRRPR